MAGRNIVLDANILIRGVLGARVSDLMLQNADKVNLVAPDAAFAEARRYVPALLASRGIETSAAASKLDALMALVNVIDVASYEPWRAAALERIRSRDPDDWPALACALMIGCPIWTEDADFFGTGVATWTTSRVTIFFSADEQASDNGRENV